MKIKAGDKLPNSELFYLDKNNDLKKVNILDLCKEKTIILGMPGAFTKTCSTLHLPGYVKNFELALRKGISKIICIAVNDPNVSTLTTPNSIPVSFSISCCKFLAKSS